MACEICWVGGFSVVRWRRCGVLPFNGPHAASPEMGHILVALRTHETNSRRYNSDLLPANGGYFIIIIMIIV